MFLSNLSAGEDAEDADAGLLGLLGTNASDDSTLLGNSSTDSTAAHAVCRMVLAMDGPRVSALLPRIGRTLSRAGGRRHRNTPVPQPDLPSEVQYAVHTVRAKLQ